MTNLSPARQLFKSYRFEEAVTAYKRQLQSDPEKKWANMDGLAESLLASGQYGAAIPIFEKVNEYLSNRMPGALGCQEQLSVCHWMIGDRQVALDTIRELVVAVRDGRITFTDIAGGVSQGLILCYMGATLRARSDIDLAMSYLKKLASRPRIQHWPGPAAVFLLGGVTFGDAVKSATGFIDIAQAKAAAEEDLWKRRRLSNILFSAGTERRMAGDEAGCRMFMVECADLTNPLVEYEWYLAKSEVSGRS